MTLAQMSFRSVLALSGLSFSLTAQATPPATGKTAPAPVPKSQYNTNIFEAADETMSFTDVVRVVRDYEGQSEVLFVGKSGVFTGPTDSQSMNLLVESQSAQEQVTVQFNETSRKILRVTKARKSGGGAGK